MHGEGTPFVPVAVYGNRHYDDAVLELKTLGEAAGCVTLGAAAFVGAGTASIPIWAVGAQTLPISRA